MDKNSKAANMKADKSLEEQIADALKASKEKLNITIDDLAAIKVLSRPQGQAPQLPSNTARSEARSCSLRRARRHRHLECRTGLDLSPFSLFQRPAKAISPGCASHP